MMINTNEPTCPTCGGTLIPDSHYDIEIEEQSSIIVYQVGCCDHCGNEYRWQEHYAYKGFSDVKKGG